MEYSSRTICSAELQTRVFPNRSLNKLIVRDVLLVIYTRGAQLRQNPNLWDLSALKDAKFGYIYINFAFYFFINTCNVISNLVADLEGGKEAEGV